MKFSNSTFWNGLDYKNIKYKFLLFIVFVEVGVDILMRHSLSWRKIIVFLEIFEVILCQCRHNWRKNLEFQNTLRSTLKKWPFPFQVYTKKIQDQFSECKEFKKFKEFNSSSSSLFALSQKFKEFKNFKNFSGVQEPVYLGYY